MVASFATDIRNRCYCFQFNDEILAVSNVDAIRLYDANTHDFLFALSEVDSHAHVLRLKGQFIVGGMWDGFIRMWDISAGGAFRNKIFAHQLPVYCLDVTQNWILSGSSDKCIKMYDATLQTQLAVLKGDKSVSHIQVVIHFPSGHSMTVTALQASEALQLICSGSRDKSVLAWDTRTGSCIHKIIGHDKEVSCLQFDGVKFVSGSLDSSIKVQATQESQ
jgi:WD40 repeat protein